MSNIASEAMSAPEDGAESGRVHKYALLFTLYLAQGFPFGFFGTALPVLMRQSGASLQQIGLLYTLMLPWALKFLWAPTVDRVGSRRWGHYTSWIVPLQVATILVTLAMAQIQPAAQIVPLLALGMAFNLAMATQDIGVDALCVRVLAPRERTIGTTMAMLGGLIGSIIGGGAMVIFLAQLGWQTAVYIIAAIQIVPLLFLLGFNEPPMPELSGRAKPGLRSLIDFVRRPGIAPWLTMLILFGFGSLLIAAMTRPLFVDLGLDAKTIGLMTGAIDPLATGAGLLLAPFFQRRFAAPARAFLAAGILNCIGYALYWPLAAKLIPPTAAYGVVAAEGLTTGLFSALIYSLMIGHSARATAGTDFTVQMGILTIGRSIPRILSGPMAARLGYAMHFAVGTVLYLADILWAGRVLLRSPESAERSGEERPGTEPPTNLSPVEVEVRNG